MQNTLTGKVALVTGASRGIGRAIALKLAAEGAAVVINYHGSMEKAKEVKAEIESDGGIAEIMQCNVADYQATEAMIRKVTDDFGRLDILVNNAGITRDGLLMKMSEEDYDTVLDTNLKGNETQSSYNRNGCSDTDREYHRGILGWNPVRKIRNRSHHTF